MPFYLFKMIGRLVAPLFQRVPVPTPPASPESPGHSTTPSDDTAVSIPSSPASDGEANVEDLPDVWTRDTVLSVMNGRGMARYSLKKRIQALKDRMIGGGSSNEAFLLHLIDQKDHYTARVYALLNAASRYANFPLPFPNSSIIARVARNSGAATISHLWFPPGISWLVALQSALEHRSQMGVLYDLVLMQDVQSPLVTEVYAALEGDKSNMVQLERQMIRMLRADIGDDVVVEALDFGPDANAAVARQDTDPAPAYKTTMSRVEGAPPRYSSVT